MCVIWDYFGLPNTKMNFLTLPHYKISPMSDPNLVPWDKICAGLKLLHYALL